MRSNIVRLWRVNLEIRILGRCCILTFQQRSLTCQNCKYLLQFVR